MAERWDDHFNAIISISREVEKVISDFSDLVDLADDEKWLWSFLTSKRSNVDWVISILFHVMKIPEVLGTGWVRWKNLAVSNDDHGGLVP